MQASGNVALLFDRPGPKPAEPSAPRPPARMTLVRVSPASMSIESALLFEPGGAATTREFLIRAFGVDEVDAVTFRRRQGRVDVRLAPTARSSETWSKLAAALRGAGLRDAAARDLLEHRVASLRLFDSATESVRVTRVGSALTTWRVTRYGDRRLGFSHPSLRRRAVLHRVGMELSSIYGVEALSTNGLTARVWVTFDPDLISVEQLVNVVERSWPTLLQETTPPLSPRKWIIAVGLLGFAFTAQFLRFALRPYAVAAVVLYGLPNFIQTARDVTRGKVGLPMLYATITTFVVLSGNPFPSSVMAVFMQSWPRLSERVAIGYDRRLFGNARRRFVWVRTGQSDGVEIRVDIDRLSAGDVFHLRAGDYIPVDGVIAEGFGAVDEDMLTGVMGAIDKSPGDSVYASTYLRTGTLAVRVMRDTGASAANVVAASLPIGPISRLPSNAEVERVANRNAKPSVAIAILNYVATGAVGLRVSQGLIRADYATGPRLSTQLSTVTGIADGLRQGIFIRKPSALDRLLGANVYVFDDSADLARARVAVAAVAPAYGEDARIVLSIATAAFAKRGDARAKALRVESAGRRIQLPEVQRRRRLAGAIRFEDGFGGLIEVATTAYVERAELVIPDALMPSLAQVGIEIDPDRDPRDPDIRPLWVARSGRVIGVVAFERKEPFGGAVVAALRARNKNNRFVYLSSASPAQARAIAEAAGIDTSFGGLDAATKAATIRELSRRTIWIGDGAAPHAELAIAASAVSVSVGGVATLLDDAADVILLQSDLDGLVAVRKLARAHFTRLRADYRTTYTANFIGTAGAFVAGFGSLEANLTTNLGSGLVLATRWRDLRSLARALERRDTIRLTAPTEELEVEQIGMVSTDGREGDVVEFPDPIEATPELDGV
jgi:cation transport ATPase